MCDDSHRKSLTIQASYFPSLPEEVLPLLLTKNLSSFVARDLPYSFDFLIENFMDPAHIPFAHHSLQVRNADIMRVCLCM